MVQARILDCIVYAYNLFKSTMHFSYIQSHMYAHYRYEDTVWRLTQDWIPKRAVFPSEYNTPTAALSPTRMALETFGTVDWEVVAKEVKESSRAPPPSHPSTKHGNPTNTTNNSSQGGRSSIAEAIRAARAQVLTLAEALEGQLKKHMEQY